MRLVAVTFLLVGVTPLVLGQCDQEISASDLLQGGVGFGTEIALSGDVAVLGACEADSSTGAAYVYRFDGSTWVEEQKLTASDGVEGDDFGVAVALEGNVIAVGADLDSNLGACYVFTYDGATWNEQQKILCPDSEAFSRFGWAIALSGDILLVGAFGVDDGAVANAGAAYLFSFDGASWQLDQTLRPDVPDSLGGFGYSLDLSADTAVVGAPSENQSRGAAYVYELQGSTWSFVQKLQTSDPQMSDRFSEAVSLSGDTVLLGIPGDGEHSGANYGAVYVFTRTAGMWSEQQKLIDPGAVHHLGWSVSLSGNTALLGSRGNSNIRTGRAFFFEQDGGAWTLEQTIVGQNIEHELGHAVSLDGDFAVVGAPKKFGDVTDTARVYTHDGTSWVYFGFSEHPVDLNGACPGETVTLSATVEGPSPLTLQWQRDGIDISGEVAETLFIDPVTADDIGTYTLVATSPCGVLTSFPAEVICFPFQRGDADINGVVDPLADSIAILLAGFSGGPLPCHASADTNGDGTLQILPDAIFLLQYGFLGGPTPPAPFPNCGSDPTPWGPGCFESPCM